MRAEDANELLGRLYELQEVEASLKASAREKIDEINRQLADELKPLDEEIGDIEVSLERYHREVAGRSPTIRTIELPNGILEARANQPRWIYDDEAAFVAWACTNRPELTRQPDPPPLAPDKNAVKKILVPVWDENDPPGTIVKVVDPDTQEIVPGLTVEVPDSTYRPKPGTMPG